MALPAPKLPVKRPGNLRPPPVDDDLDAVVSAQMGVEKNKALAPGFTGKAAPEKARPPQPEAPPKQESPRGKVPTRAQAPVDDLDEVVDERMAAEEEIDVRNAQATQESRARSGLMGGGLSGASSAAEGDLANQQARSKALALQDFDRQAENDDFTDIQRQAAIADLEDAYDTDVDGDKMINGRPIDIKGGIGDGNPENDPDNDGEFKNDDQQAAASAEDLAKKNTKELKSDDLLMGDENTEPGTQEEPWVFEGNIQDLTGYLRDTGAWPLTQIEYGGVTMFRDQHGNVYVLDRS